jgi:hypothetical protein
MPDEITDFERQADELAEALSASADTELDLEAPEADAVEQHIELFEHRYEPTAGPTAGPDIEADPADVAEQRRVVDLDEDDYR